MISKNMAFAWFSLYHSIKVLFIIVFNLGQFSQINLDQNIINIPQN